MFSWEYSIEAISRGISFDIVGLEDAIELEKEFSEAEVWKAINDLGKDKVLDGF